MSKTLHISMPDEMYEALSQKSATNYSKIAEYSKLVLAAHLTGGAAVIATSAQSDTEKKVGYTPQTPEQVAAKAQVRAEVAKKNKPLTAAERKQKAFEDSYEDGHKHVYVIENGEQVRKLVPTKSRITWGEGLKVEREFEPTHGKFYAVWKRHEAMWSTARAVELYGPEPKPGTLNVQENMGGLSSSQVIEMSDEQRHARFAQLEAEMQAMYKAKTNE